MIIYKATNKVNGKVYIGQTIQPFEKRINNHRNHHKSNSHFPLYRAFKKYGFASFEWEIIDSALLVEDLDDKERYWIKFYNSTNGEYGYNVAEGGHGSFGYKHKEESKLKMSMSKRGKKMSEEHKKLISEAHRRNMKTQLAILTVEQALEIKRLLVENKVMIKDIADEFNMTVSAIECINYKKTWQHIKLPNEPKGNYRPKGQSVNYSKTANSKITEEIVKEIRVKFMNGVTNKEIMNEYNLSKSTVKTIKMMQAWTWVVVEGYDADKLRQKKYKPEIKEKALLMVSEGKTYKVISELLGVSQPNICRWVKESR